MSEPINAMELGDAVARELLRRIDSKQIVASDVEVEGPAWSGHTLGTATRYYITFENGLEVRLTRSGSTSLQKYWLELYDGPTRLAGSFTSSEADVVYRAVEAVAALAEVALAARRETARTALGLE